MSSVRRSGGLVRSPTLTDWLFFEKVVEANSSSDGTTVDPTSSLRKTLSQENSNPTTTDAREQALSLVWVMGGVLLPPALFLLGAGRWQSHTALLLAALLIATAALSFLYLRPFPYVLREWPLPVRFSPTTPIFDRTSAILGNFLLLLWAPAVGADTERYRWSPILPLIVQAAGGGLYLAGLVCVVVTLKRRAMKEGEGRGAVEDDKERSMEVKTKRVKRMCHPFVHRPMFVGSTAVLVGVPLLLGSLVGAAINVALGIGLYIRALRERSVVHKCGAPVLCSPRLIGLGLQGLQGSPRSPKSLARLL